MSATGSQKAPGAAEPASERVEPAWRAWLEALASDAEAALGATLAYQTLDDKARSAVLDVLEKDSMRLDVPRVAVFAPLLSVEHDETRRERIRLAMGDDVGPNSTVPARALVGHASDGDLLIVAETHAYLDFVHVTTCRIEPGRGIRWVRREPLVHVKDAVPSGRVVEDTELEQVPFSTAIDLIARAIVAQRRADGTLPESLHPLVELFDARVCDAAEDVRR